jgi:UDP-N-acetyl-D-glucosamine dehydrogenase
MPELSFASPPPALTDIAIVGLGFIGLPLSLQFARSGVSVLGLDLDLRKLDALNERRSYIEHVAAATVAEEVKANRLDATTDFARVNEVQAVIICVPTAVNKKS